MDTTLEIDGASIISPEAADGNYNILAIGNDKSLAFGPEIDPIAANNLEIKTDQNSGDCGCCKSSYKEIPIHCKFNHAEYANQWEQSSRDKHLPGLLH